MHKTQTGTLTRAKVSVVHSKLSWYAKLCYETIPMDDSLACPPRIGLIYLDLMAPARPKSLHNGLGLNYRVAVDYTRLCWKKRG